jgi:hypothetical protein
MSLITPLAAAQERVVALPLFVHAICANRLTLELEPSLGHNLFVFA